MGSLSASKKSGTLKILQFKQDSNPFRILNPRQDFALIIAVSGKILTPLE